MATEIDRARDAWARQEWRQARELFAAADSLLPSDLELFSIAAHLTGDDAECVRVLELAHDARLEAGESERAAYCAFWIGLNLLLRGEWSRGGGWLARASGAIEDAEFPCAARGLLLVPAFIETFERGDLEAAASLADEMTEISRACSDADLTAFAALCRGEAAIAGGDISAGLKALDEIMLAAISRQLSPMCTGIMFCAAIEQCTLAFDVRRAAEWTDALTGWCGAQPDLVPYRGQCLVHRSEVFLRKGAWDDAAAEIARACERLADPPHPALGLAWYQQGELHRLRGELTAAERAYQAARECGREPAPGFALLRRASGDTTAAVAAIRRMIAESHGPTRGVMLAAAVDIFLTASQIDNARTTADELAALARDLGAPLVDAMAAYANGAVRIAQDDAPSALPELRRASAQWHALGMPYDVARARVQIALACRVLGDDAAAELEFATARGEFERLGARPDQQRVDALTGIAPSTDLPISEREQEVLRLVASGLTNREIAAELSISEHTVARHLQNMFLKLGLSSRAAATAYAYEHGVV